MKARNRILSLITIAGEAGVRSAQIGEITKTGTGKLYAVLQDLEREALVRSQFDEGAKPRKRRYWLIGGQDATGKA